MGKFNVIAIAGLLALAWAAMSSAQMQGDTVGVTQYPYQIYNGGQRIAVDNQANIHVAWTRYLNQTGNIYYNFKSPAGWGWPGTGTQVDRGSGAIISVLPDDRAAIFYHKALTNNESLFVSVDDIPGQGFWSYYYIPARLTSTHRYIWPNGTVSRNGDLHVVATWNNPTTGGWQDFIYTRSNDGGTTWTAITRVDTLMTISPIVVASHMSDKVAIIYTHPIDTSSQRMNDIYYVLSNDGVSWDFRNNKTNVTNYGQGGDSLYAFVDVDAVFDYNDNLHIAWNAMRVGPDSLIEPVYLYHFNRNLGTINEITHHYMPESQSCHFYPWMYSINSISLASDIGNHIFVLYCRFDSSDCSASGEANGELFTQYSINGGATWGQPANLTSTPSPDCIQPDCLSEIYPSAAAKFDTAMHIFFTGYRGYGAPYHPMLYRSWVPNAVDDAVKPPGNFALHANYPNPFNASTTIAFDLDRAGEARLEVFDITGRRVATLLHKMLEAGHYDVTWDAGHLPSGVYHYRLGIDGESQSKRMILLK